MRACTSFCERGSEYSDMLYGYEKCLYFIAWNVCKMKSVLFKAYIMNCMTQISFLSLAFNVNILLRSIENYGCQFNDYFISKVNELIYTMVVDAYKFK